MNFTRLRICNFLTIGDSGDLGLSSRGLNLIQGVNDDDSSALSNGAGKSTVPDALCWALYGTTARGESGDAVINSIAKKNCSVLVEFTDGPNLYVVTRYRKHVSFKNELRFAVIDGGVGALVDLTKGTEKDTQAEVTKVMGCTYEVFRAAVYAGQEEMPDLPAMTDKTLKLLIEEAAGVQRLEKAYEIARKKEAEIAASVINTQQRHMNALEEVRVGKVKVETALIRHKEFEDGRQKRVDDVLFEAEKCRLEAVAIVKDLKTVDEAVLQVRAQAITNELSGIHAAYAKANQYDTLAVKPAEAKLTSAQTEYRFQLSLAQRHRERYDNAEHELGKPCSSCGKSHTPEDLEQLKASVKKQLVEQLEVTKTASAAVAAAEQAVATARENLQKLRDAVPDASKLNEERVQVDEAIRKYTRGKFDAQAKLAQNNSLREKAEQLRKEPNPQDSLIESLKADIAKQEQAAEQLRKVLDALNESHEVSKSVTKVFSPAGVRAHILDTVTPFLNDRTADYLSTLSDGNISATWSTLSRTAKGELREKFGIEVENTKGAKSFKGLSGGEKRKVRLACMLALQDLVASRATKSIGLWMGDEIDDALDEAGLERLMTILEKKAREKGTVLIISHNSLSDWCDQVTTVRKTGGVSTVEGALVDV